MISPARHRPLAPVRCSFHKVQRQAPDGSLTTVAYDPVGQLVGTMDTDHCGTPVAQAPLAFDPAGARW